MAYQKLQANRAAAVTPSDTADIPSVNGATGTNNGCSLYIGSAGSVKLKTVGGDVLTFVGCYAGQFLPINVLQVFNTGTTASDIVALW